MSPQKHILPLATTWINLKGITFGEISQRKTNTIMSHIYVESKQKKKRDLIKVEYR